MLRALPGPRDSFQMGEYLFLNNRGLFTPRPIFESGFENSVNDFDDFRFWTKFLDSNDFCAQKILDFLEIVSIRSIFFINIEHQKKAQQWLF